MYCILLTHLHVVKLLVDHGTRGSVSLGGRNRDHPLKPGATLAPERLQTGVRWSGAGRGSAQLGGGYNLAGKLFFAGSVHAK